jgi:preprotein translocase subunit SecG
MQVVLVALHLIICIALIVIVLLQTGKGSEIGAVFGSSSQTLFGSTGGSTFFGKLTTGVAVVFLLTSLILAARSGRVTSESVMSGVQPAATAPAVTEIETPAATPVEEKATQADVPGETPAGAKQVPSETPATEQQTTVPTDSGEKQPQ